MTPDRWRQIEDLYHAAQACSPHERAALLECTDPEIRSRVERMLAVESGSQILDQSADGPLADPTQTVIVNGTQLGPYRIEAQIGAGGMGTVYRALDTRLRRVVAIKIAAERYSERFQLEARAISTLNHPNICTLYDVGPNYLVMEFIEGSTLAAELKKGPLAPEIAARYGAQTAGALAEAHSLGIVHRDLKPSNIMLTRHGVKVLDFGLAKVLTETGITQTDAVMGTPAYMAPEQLDGKEADPRSDLFALGLVLYEMASGQLPFPGASLGSMLLSGGSVTFPPLSRIHPGASAGLDALIARLLEPDLRKRAQSSAQVRDQLQTLAVRPPRRAWQISTAAALMILLIVVGLWMYRRFVHSAPIGQVNQVARITAYPGNELEPALSPDGSQVAFSWTGDKGGNRDIYLMQIGGQTPLRLTNDPAEDNFPAWSPDGKQIAFLRQRGPNLWDVDVVPALGGPERKLYQTALETYHLGDSHPVLAWSHDGKQLILPHEGNDIMHLFVLSMETGLARSLDLGATAGTVGESSPAISPDGGWLAFRRYITLGYGQMMVQKLKPGIEPDGAPIVASGALIAATSPSWSPDSRRLIFSDGSRLFQWERGQTARLIYAGALRLDGVSAVWRAGHLRAVAAGSNNHYNIWSLPLNPRTHQPAGPAVRVVPSSANDVHVRFSPDGKRFAFVSDRGGSYAVWIADRDGSNLRQITRLDGSDTSSPQWSPDGRHIAFHAHVPDQSQLYVVDPDAGVPRKITDNPFGFHGPVWMPDGEHLLAWQIMRRNRGNVFRVRIADGFAEELFEGVYPLLTPDGKRILYGK
jgi:Tol biopolymer transport system component/predicted Ser/Thr protein kinase